MSGAAEAGRRPRPVPRRSIWPWDDKSGRFSQLKAAALVLQIAPTGSWKTWATVTLAINLAAGVNSIELVATSGTGGPNVDWMGVGLA